MTQHLHGGKKAQERRRRKALEQVERRVQFWRKEQENPSRDWAADGKQTVVQRLRTAEQEATTLDQRLNQKFD